MAIQTLIECRSSLPKATALNGKARHRLRKSRPRWQIILRSNGLALFYRLFPIVFKKKLDKKLGPEEKKIATCKNFWTAIFVGTIHIVPIAAAIILLALNGQGYYIGSELTGPSGYDDLKFIGLQFAAKFHELTLNASLTAVVLSYIRHEMAIAGGLPFGAIFAGFQFRDLSFLWSTELWGAICARFTRPRRRWTLCFLVFICALLSVSVGPSSAILMRPRLDYWPAGGTDFWVNIPQGQLGSTNVRASQVSTNCSIDTGDSACPYADWQTIAENYLAFWTSPRAAGYLPTEFYMPSAKSSRLMTTVTRSPYWQYSEKWTVATVSSSSVADGLSETGRLWVLAASKNLPYKGVWGLRRFWSNNDALFRIEAEQPIVQARCLQSHTSDFSKQSQGPGDLPPLRFYDLSGKRSNGSDFGTVLPSFPNNASIASIQQTANSSAVPQLVWTNIVEENVDPFLAAILFIPANNSKDTIGAQMYACTLDARNAPVSMEATGNDPSYVSGFPRGTYDTNTGNYDFGGVETFKFGSLETYVYGNSWPKISIDYDWAEYLNPTIGTNNTTMIANILRTTGLWNSTQYINPNDSKYAVEAILSTAVVNGLARRDYGKGFAGHLLGHEDQLLGIENTVPKAGAFESWCDDWCKAMLPSFSQSMGYGSSAFNVSNAERLNSTKFTMRASANGYAYNNKGSAQRFAMTILCLYAVIAVGHWVYLGWSRESSSSWDSIAELVALAMSSTPSTDLTNTGAGIDSFQVFQNQTQVIDRDGHLELAFGVPSGRYEKVKPDELYG